jgi:hypothetical protein
MTMCAGSGELIEQVQAPHGVASCLRISADGPQRSLTQEQELGAGPVIAHESSRRQSRLKRLACKTKLPKSGVGKAKDIEEAHTLALGHPTVEDVQDGVDGLEISACANKRIDPREEEGDGVGITLFTAPASSIWQI